MPLQAIKVDLGDRGYTVQAGAGLLARAGEFISRLDAARRVVVITNPTVAALYLEPLRAALQGVKGDPSIEVVEIPDGERFKNLETLELIYDAVLDGGSDRSILMVALGGGVVGDVAGFAAATVLRGIRLVMLPTTLLAQVDSSVGGKTAINRPQGKNLVGAFYQPSLVLADIDTLASLPPREYAAGLAEVVKYGVILDAGLFELIEKRRRDVLAVDPAVMTEVVSRCVKLKAAVVEKDERESGLRRILNFGHTIGHALEKSTSYSRYLHGEAVAIGMVAAMRISWRLGLCDENCVSRLESLLHDLGLETALPADMTPALLAEAVGFDKKAAGDGVVFIVVGRIGAVSERTMSRSQLESLLDLDRR